MDELSPGITSRWKLDDRYPEAPLSLTSDDVQLLNYAHTWGYDKFYRMFAGCGSALISYIDGVAEIEIKTSAAIIDAEGTGKRCQRLGNQITAWGHERLLSRAKLYIVHLIQRELAVGFNFNLPLDADAQARMEQAIEEMKTPTADIKVGEWRIPSSLIARAGRAGNEHIQHDEDPEDDGHV
jgi:hypothetical protein